jgi:hypothetical protein
MRSLLLLLLLLCVCGCVESRLVELPPPPKEIPSANIPDSLRYKNWPDRNGSGSCVIASSVLLLNGRIDQT